MAKPESHPPLDILSKAATVETLMTWLIAGWATSDRRGFGWFMRYAADRIPVSEKIKMIGEVVDALSDPSAVYPELLDDLRVINSARVTVAHAAQVFLPTEGNVYLTVRKGLATRLPDDEIQAIAEDALTRLPKVQDAFAVIRDQANLPFPVVDVTARG